MSTLRDKDLLLELLERDVLGLPREVVVVGLGVVGIVQAGDLVGEEVVVVAVGGVGRKLFISCI